MNLACVVCMVILEVAASHRVKRILFGDQIQSFGFQNRQDQFTSPYDAIYYSVGMKPGWANVAFSAEFDERNNAYDNQIEHRRQTLGTQRNGRCGGSFLTAEIVQTACHCVAHFIGVEGLAKLVWEEPLVIYSLLGPGVARPFGNGIYSPKRYYAHMQCNVWRGRHTRIIMYDYALITLAKGKWGSTNPQPRIFPRLQLQFAPLYTAGDLNVYYRNILSRQSTCLFLGHGYNTMGIEEGVLSVYRLRSTADYDPKRLPAFTWRTITGYRYCYDYLESYLNYTIKINDEMKSTDPLVWYGPDRTLHEPEFLVNSSVDPEFAKEGTFVCTMNAGKFQAVPSVGDGGYPVTCNNVYFAVQGTGWTKTSPMDRMAMSSPITYAKWENAAEFRDDLVAKMGNWSNYTYTKMRFSEIGGFPRPNSLNSAGNLRFLAGFGIISISLTVKML